MAKSAKIHKAAISIGAACFWCGSQFRRLKQGGSTQQFCTAKCRKEFHAARRAYADWDLATGRAEIADLKNALKWKRARSSTAQEGFPSAT